MAAPKRLLTLAGILSSAVAAFQFALTFSPSLSRSFGAPEELLTGDPLLLYLSSFVAAAIFGIWGLYAFSGAGRIRHLSLLRTGLLVIGGLYTLRGLMLVPEILITLGLLQATATPALQELCASLVALSTGVLYLVGTFGGWQGPVPHTKNA